jgi:hypothetical protein
MPKKPNPAALGVVPAAPPPAQIDPANPSHRAGFTRHVTSTVATPLSPRGKGIAGHGPRPSTAHTGGGGDGGSSGSGHKSKSPIGRLYRQYRQSTQDQGGPPDDTSPDQSTPTDDSDDMGSGEQRNSESSLASLPMVLKAFYRPMIVLCSPKPRQGRPSYDAHPFSRYR